jgi:hypothetical protein
VSFIPHYTSLHCLPSLPSFTASTFQDRYYVGENFDDRMYQTARCM